MPKKKTGPKAATVRPEETGANPVPAQGPSYPEAAPAAAQGELKWWLPLLFSVAFFLVTLLTTESTIKPLVMALIAAVLVSGVVRFFTLSERLSWPLVGVALWVVINGASMFYANSGKFALREFLRIMVGFCVFLLILLWSGKEKGGRGRLAASMLEGGTALAALFSIDMLSTHWLSVPLFRFLQRFSLDYIMISNNAVETGVRMNSLYENPNVYAGVAGLGVLLALELAVTAENKKERCFHLVCLFWNALSFLLVFSMGASGTIAVAFLVFLVLERRERKGALLALMIETFLLVLVCVFPIYLTAFDGWKGFQPVPLLCALGGAAVLCAADLFVGRKVSQHLVGRGKLLTVLIVAVLVVIGAFAALAMNLTGPASLGSGESLRRAEYPAAGTYTLDVQASGAVTVTIESQNQEETMMHTSTYLYSGDAQGAEFTVPEDSLVVYFNFWSSDSVTLDAVSYSGSGGQGSLKLNYKLLPGFISNRLQGLFANENAIQRTVFFADGMKLFQESPLIGQGLGAFQNGVRHIQSFYYVTAYAHNHYIETLLSTGIIGLILFVGMLALCAAAVLLSLRKEHADPLAPGLGAALVFIMGHGAVEVVLSFSFYLPIALGVLGLICLCCGEALPLLPSKEEVHPWSVVALGALVGAFGVTLLLNMRASSMIEKGSGNPYRMLEQAVKTDLYEWSDYAVSYLYTAQGIDREAHWDIYTQANSYAQRLGKLKSNAIPPYVAQYYFSTDQRQLAYEVLDRYVTYLISDNESWQTAFDLLESYSDGSAEEKAEVMKLYQQFQTWNEQNMGSLSLRENNLAYIESLQNL